MATADENRAPPEIRAADRPEETTPNPLAYGEGINLQQVIVDGWEAWMLLDRAANGHRRPIALLDAETLERINHQTAEALAKIHEKGAPS